MRFSVDGWDPAYGNAYDTEALPETAQQVNPDVEEAVGSWAPRAPRPGVGLPSATLFVDGVRRIDARVWIDPADPDDTPQPSICASIAAGVVCCRAGRAHCVSIEERRLLVTADVKAADLPARGTTWKVAHTSVSPGIPHLQALSLALQKRLGDIEVGAALAARQALAGHLALHGDDLLVIDGPLRGRPATDRTVGYVKTHHTTYLPKELNAVVGRLAAGERTPVFLLGNGWDRYSWYLRLPALSRAPWAGVVRLECHAEMSGAEAVSLADLSQVVLPPHASAEFRDPRAPQNLTPIGGLEHELRHRLGDARLLYRSLREAEVGAASPHIDAAGIATENP